MKTRNYLILGAVVIGLGVAAVNVFSTGTDNNSDAVTESVTNNTAQPAITTNPTPAVDVAPNTGVNVNKAESATEGVNTEEANTNNTAE